MSSYTVTIPQAIEQGKRQVIHPAMLLLYGSGPTGLLLAILTGAWWLCPLFLLGGIPLSMLVQRILAARWAVWAYSRVSNVHQLQRSAELAKIFPPTGLSGIVSVPELTRPEQEKITARLAEPETWENDCELRDTTFLSFKPGRKHFGAEESQEIILSDEGITTATNGLHPWSGISQEYAVRKLYFRRRHNYLSYQYAGMLIELRLCDLQTSMYEVDYLLWIYRGRYQQTMQTAAAYPPSLLKSSKNNHGYASY